MLQQAAAVGKLSSSQTLTHQNGKNASPQNMLVYGSPAVRPSGAEIPQNARLTGVWQWMAKKIFVRFCKNAPLSRNTV